MRRLGIRGLGFGRGEKRRVRVSEMCGRFGDLGEKRELGLGIWRR